MEHYIAGPDLRWRSGLTCGVWPIVSERATTTRFAVVASQGQKTAFSASSVQRPRALNGS